jgi:branched-chain amino acid transport system permease protein
VLGFGGMYQFHHAVFYGAGAYAFALFVHEIRPARVVRLCNCALFVPPLGAGAGVDHGPPEPNSTSACCKFLWVPWSGPSPIAGIHLPGVTTVSTAIPLPDLVGSSTGAYYFNLIVTASCLLLMYHRQFALRPDFPGNP